jgi:hypothetical protein
MISIFSGVNWKTPTESYPVGVFDGLSFGLNQNLPQQFGSGVKHCVKKMNVPDLDVRKNEHFLADGRRALRMNVCCQ